jgi:hypothetical protein
MTLLHPIDVVGLRLVRLVAPAVALLATLTLSNCASVAQDGRNTRTITVRPGDDLQKIIQSADKGSVFRLSPGVYRLQSITPKDNDHLIGESGVILSGAQILSKWRRADGHWSAIAPQKRLPPHGECEDERDLCKFREDLFIDGALYRPVASKDQIGPGKWYRDDTDIVLSDDPTGRLVEMSAMPAAISGAAKGVVLEKLIIEKYASAAQEGAIDARESENWKLIDVVTRWNHGVGLYLGKGMHVIRGSFSSNGQLGIGGQGDSALIDGAEIAHNNYAGFSTDWEAGGTKFVRSRNLEVRNSCVHDNAGPGLWTDIDNVDITYTKNKVFRNDGDGIKHEISFRATVVKNIVAENGKAKDAWLWGSQILIQNSSNVDVRENTVEVASSFGNGISVVSQDREAGKLGAYEAKHNYIHRNTIIHKGEHGYNGMVVDANIDNFWKSNNNRFDRNTYILAVPKQSLFGVNNEFASWEDARAHGFETHGTLKVEKRAPLSLDCGK